MERNIHGDLMFYYDNGNKKSSMHFDDHGMKVGYWEGWYPDGSIKSECHYENNKEVDHELYYYENGQLCYDVHYLYDTDNQIDMIYKSWNKDGSKMFEQCIYDGVVTKWVTWHKNGVMSSFETKNKNGKHLILWNENGHILSDMFFGDNDQRIGEHNLFYDNGQCAEKTNYNIKGQIDGKMTTWYENGKIHTNQSFRDGTPIGEYVYYDSDHLITIAASYT